MFVQAQVIILNFICNCRFFNIKTVLCYTSHEFDFEHDVEEEQIKIHSTLFVGVCPYAEKPDCGGKLKLKKKECSLWTLVQTEVMYT